MSEPDWKSRAERAEAQNAKLRALKVLIPEVRQMALSAYRHGRSADELRLLNLVVAAETAISDNTTPPPDPELSTLRAKLERMKEALKNIRAGRTHANGGSAAQQMWEWANAALADVDPIPGGEK